MLVFLIFIITIINCSTQLFRITKIEQYLIINQHEKLSFVGNESSEEINVFNELMFSRKSIRCVNMSQDLTPIIILPVLFFLNLKNCIRAKEDLIYYVISFFEFLP